MLASLVSYWGEKAGVLTSWSVLIAIPLFHAIVYLLVIGVISKFDGKHHKARMTYAEAMQWLRDRRHPWDFFNTNPVFCLRTHVLGAEKSGWLEVVNFLLCNGTTLHKVALDKCVPFVRGKAKLVLESSQRTTPRASAR